jgi:Ca2+-binding EF-hand superfamily protein
VVFQRVDKDHSGVLDMDELRIALRRTVRIPPSVISDPQIASLWEMIDKEGKGSLSITDLVDFLGAEPEVSKRTGRPFHGPMLQGGGTTLPDVTPRKHNQPQKSRPYRPPLKKAALEEIRNHIKSAAYTGVFGKQLDVIFGRFDKDGSGQLEDNELRQALRACLKIPPKMISDAQIWSLCAELDKDDSGAISIQELIAFVGNDPVVSQRTGKKMQTKMEAADEFLKQEAVSLPSVA